jgi:hypothetical protein
MKTLVGKNGHHLLIEQPFHGQQVVHKSTKSLETLQTSIGSLTPFQNIFIPTWLDSLIVGVIEAHDL